MLFYPYNIKNNSQNSNYLSPNEINDSIGGILNSLIDLYATILTFLAFYIQYQANKNVQ